MFVLVVTAPLALIVWAATPRITSPTQLAGQGVEVGLTEIVRRDIVDQLSSELAERRQSPAESTQMRSVFERSMTQAWFDEQVMSVATELDEWLAGTDPQPPELVVDLRPVKASLAADPEALFLVADLIGSEQAEGSVAVALAGVPDEVSLLSDAPETGSPEGLFTARSFLTDVRTARQLIPLVLLVVFALTVLLARSGGRLKSAGKTVAMVGVPLVVASLLMPVVAGQLVLNAMPQEIPLEASQVQALLSWMIEPIRPVGIGLVVAGVGAVVSSFAVDAMRRRSPTAGAAAETIQSPLRPGA